ncbi:MAG TPA: wax ester/triacylglycerol synthase family O-acyltransferase [Candidatus Dormibacteraeota bacterium]|nr:wax ester/triacylglycerol synthase family O-acyltransferase [Candidatus Dormibacteraeota bacterium]
MATASSFHYPIQLGRRMVPTDALFWYAEEATPELRPLVAGLLMLDRRPDPERLRASVERWVARLPRLRQRVVEAPLRLGLPEWEEDPNFDVEYHAREVILPEPATDRHLLDFCGAVFATPLDNMRPLWEAYLIEGLEHGRAACFFKVHHSVMDGVGSLAVFDAMTQAHRHEPVRVPRHVAAPPAQLGAARVGRLLGDALGNVASGLVAAGAASAHAVIRPDEALSQAWRAARGLRGMVADLTASPTPDPLARASTGIGRRLDAVALSLSRLQHIKEGLGVSLNDVVLTALAGAVGRYHVHRGMRVEALQCMVPMNLRPADERHALGNRVGTFTVTLPVGERDPAQRLARIRQQTSAAKSDRRGAAFPLLARALAFLPGFAYRLLAQTVTGRINLICTNVPGPPAQRFLAGARVEAIYPFAPVALGTPLSIALLSYGDTYGVGIDTDPAAIPDPELLSHYLTAAIDELEHRARPRSEGRRAARPTVLPRRAAVASRPHPRRRRSAAS